MDIEIPLLGLCWKWLSWLVTTSYADLYIWAFCICMTSGHVEAYYSLLLDRFQIRIWKVANQYKMKSQFFFFFGCVCRVLDFLVTKINNKKTSKIFQFRPTKEEKFKLMTPWFMRFFFFFGSLFLMFNLLRVIFFYNKVLSPTFS